MKWIRAFALVSAVALAVPHIAFAQDGPLGKKGGGKGGGQSGTSGGNAGGQSNNSGGGKSGGRSGGQSGGQAGLPNTPPQTGGGQTSPALGRPVTIPRQQSGDQIVVKRGGQESKSGTVKYDSNNNVQIGSGQYSGPGVVTIPRISTSREISLEARGESRNIELRADNNGNFRFGYWHYRKDWCDDDFYYPFYSFRYDPWKCVPSPFYAYYHLPPYLNCTRITIGSFSWTQCSTVYSYRRGNDDPYGWGWGRDDSRRRGDLDYAVDDIYDAFRTRRMRGLGDMIGRYVVVEYGYGERYRMSGDDFYDLMRDVVEGTYTENYLIQDVYRDGDQATVIAYHTFFDPRGIRESVRHVYGLQKVRRGYEIAYFRTERF